MRRSLVALIFLLGTSLSALALAEEPVESGLAADATSPSAVHESGHEEHVPTFDQINWYHGLLFEKEGAAPSLLYRPKGMPVPFAALLFDSLILYYVLYRFSSKPISEGLKKRKNNILRGMEEAAKMKREAEGQLAAYEDKLAKIDQDVERIKKQMRHAAEAESARILEEAKERRARMERDAQQLIEQELKAVREQLLSETIASAIRSAEQVLVQRITDADQQRLADEYLAGLGSAGATLRGRV